MKYGVSPYLSEGSQEDTPTNLEVNYLPECAVMYVIDTDLSFGKLVILHHVSSKYRRSIVHFMHCELNDKFFQHQQMLYSIYYVFYYYFAAIYFGAFAIFRQLTLILLKCTAIQ